MIMLEFNPLAKPLIRIVGLEDEAEAVLVVSIPR